MHLPHADSETKRHLSLLFASVEGASAIAVLMPLIREVALHIAGRGACPRQLRNLPQFMLPITVERARYRAAKARGEIKD